ncbi:MAG: hypothetical protein WCH86_06695 [Kiritimatiellales bacterium]
MTANAAVLGMDRDSYGVWDRAGGHSVAAYPFARGQECNLNWTEVNAARSNFTWTTLDSLLQVAEDQNQMYTVKVAPIEGASAGKTMPIWMFSAGVPSCSDGLYTYGYYLDPEFKIYFEEMVRAFAKHVRQDVATNLQKRIAFVRVDTGATGDETPYENGTSVTPTQYQISDPEWLNYRLWVFELYRQAFQTGPGPVIPLLFAHIEPIGYPAEWTWITNNVTGSAGAKYDGSTRGHHLSTSRDTPDSFKTLAVDSNFKMFSRSEMDGTWEWPYFQLNLKSSMYWTAVEQLNAGMTIWDLTGNCLEATYSSNFLFAVDFFNKWAAELDPATARGGFCIFHEGLDSSDTVKFPTSTYGSPASQSNTNRYTAICAAYSNQGARMDHLVAATWGHVKQRPNQTGYNDSGWKIVPGNYDRFITQINPTNESLAVWRVRGTLTPSSHSFDRFARRFDRASGRNTMYFDVNDHLTPTPGQSIQLSVIYLDSGTNRFGLLYDAVGNSQKSAFTVTKANSNTWKTNSVVVTDWAFGNNGPNGSDLALTNMDLSGDTTFHSIELVKQVNVTMNTVGQGTVSARNDGTIYSPVSGTYATGLRLEMTVTPSAGWKFSGWSGDLSGTDAREILYPTNVNTQVTATFANIFNTYTLAITNGTGSGSYTNGQQVAIVASNAPSGKVFDRWTGHTQYVASVTSSNTTVTMPAQNISLTATYTDLPGRYTLTVNSGSGSGSYTNGQQVAISASAISGKTFTQWTGDVAYVNNVTYTNALVTMSTNAVTLTATYTDIPGRYTLTVNSGSGSGSYTNGQQVAISASAISGKIFAQWTGDVAYVNNVTYTNALVTMSTNAVTLTATYVDSTPAAIAVVDSTGGSISNTVLPISQVFSTTGGNVLVVNLSYKAVNNTYPTGPLTLDWVTSSGAVTQTMTRAVQAGNSAAKAFGSSIFYLWNPTAGSGTISGGLPAGYQAQIISAFTLSGVDTNISPVIASAINDASSGAASITSSTATGVPVGGFAALCSASAATATGTGFSASTSSGTAANWLTSAVVGGYWYQGYIPNLAGGNTTFSCTHGTAARLHIVAAVFSPGISVPSTTYTLTVNNGTGGGSYTNGTQVAITASNLFAKTFAAWIGDTQYAANSNSASTTVTMPAQAISLTATYADIYYTLTANGGIGGTVSPASTNVLSGGSADFVITASNYYRIATLTTNGTAVTGMSFDNDSTTTNFTWNDVQYSGTLAATFTEQITTNPVASGANVPYSWMARHGLTNSGATFDQAAAVDQDGDGLTAWQEYIAGTDPTNTTSGFKAVQNNRDTVSWSPVSGRVYSVYWATNLMNGFQCLESNIPWTQSSFTNATPDSRVNHYQIKVRMQ